MEKLLKAIEAADLLGLDTQGVYRYCREGVIPHIRIGAQIRIPQSALQKWIDSQLSIHLDQPKAQEPGSSVVA